HAGDEGGAGEGRAVLRTVGGCSLRTTATGRAVGAAELVLCGSRLHGISRATQKHGAGDEKGDQDEPGTEGDLPEQNFLFFYDAKRASGEDDARVCAGDAARDTGYADAGLGLPGDLFGAMRADISKYAGGRHGDGAIQIAGGAHGSSCVVVEDDERFEALREIDGTGGDYIFGLAA